MPRRLFDLYQRKRVVNINANIVASGILAIVIAKYPVHLAGQWIGPERKLLVTFAAGGIDMVVDIALYYALHWLANHWNPPWKRSKRAKPKRSFFHDASLIQFERALLSPLYYFVAMGLMYILQRADVRHSWAFVIGFMTGIVITRVVHTLWGIRSGRFNDASMPDHGHADAEPPSSAPNAADSSLPTQHRAPSTEH